MVSRLPEPTPYTMQPITPPTPPDDPNYDPTLSPGERETNVKLPGEREARPNPRPQYVFPTAKRPRTMTQPTK